MRYKYLKIIIWSIFNVESSHNQSILINCELKYPWIISPPLKKLKCVSTMLKVIVWKFKITKKSQILPWEERKISVPRVSERTQIQLYSFAESFTQSVAIWGDSFLNMSNQYSKKIKLSSLSTMLLLFLLTF